MKETAVITISRQYGSGGRELANIVANKLGVRLYDRQIVHLAAAKLGIDDLSEAELRDLEENVPPLPLSFVPFYSFGNSAAGSLNDKIFITEAKVIHQLARDGSCVILGRCADYVLQKEPNHFSFFICADNEYREQRGIVVYDGKTLEELEREDKKRAFYYEHYAGRKWGDPANYDLVINSGRLGLEKAADLIIHYVEQRKNHKDIGN